MFVSYDPVENKVMFYNGFEYEVIEVVNRNLVLQFGHLPREVNITAVCIVNNKELKDKLEKLYTLRNEISQLRALRTDIFISGTTAERFLYWLDKPTKQDKIMWPQVKTLKKYE